MGAPVQRSVANTMAPGGMSKTGNSRPCSQTMGSVGRCTSVRLGTRTGSLRERRKPNRSAREDSPSRIRMAPRSTRAGHSTLAAAPVRATKIRDTPAGWRWRPMDERMSGQAPASSERTLKYGREAAAESGAARRRAQRKARKRIAYRDVISPQRRRDAEISAENTMGNGEGRRRSPSFARIDRLKPAPPQTSELRSDGQGGALSHWLALAGEGIPASGAEVVEGGAARRVVDQILAAQRVEGQVHGLGEIEAEGGTGLDEMRPVLAFGIDSGVAVPVELQRAEIVSGARLRVEQEILIETADVERIQGGVG